MLYHIQHHRSIVDLFIDQLDLRGFAIVGQDWGGPQGVGAALQRIERLAALILMKWRADVGRFVPAHDSTHGAGGACDCAGSSWLWALGQTDCLESVQLSVAPRWLRKFIVKLDLQRITLVCQDWGGLLVLRVLSQMPVLFAKVVAMNTGIGQGGPPGEAFLRWRRFALRAESLDIGRLMNATLVNRKLTDAEAAAYNAPFPSKEYQTGALVFPRLVPIRYDRPGAYDNRVAIERLRKWICRHCSCRASRTPSPRRPKRTCARYSGI